MFKEGELVGDIGAKEYFQSLYKEDSKLIQQLERYAEEYNVPIIEKDSIELLKQLIRIHQPKRILEIGTAIGYSAIQMASAYGNSFITTIEMDEYRYEEAVKHIKEALLDHRIEVILQRGETYIENLSKSSTFDFVFIDAAKAQYQSYVELIDPHLKPHGLIVIDNVYFKGYVMEENNASKRLQKLGQKINHFNKWLIENDAYDTTFVASGDGLAIAIKK